MVNLALGLFQLFSKKRNESFRFLYLTDPYCEENQLPGAIDFLHSPKGTLAYQKAKGGKTLRTKSFTWV